MASTFYRNNFSKVLQIQLNISYSSLSTFKKSPLEYYFYKIAKLVPVPVNSCYGDAGNAVHDALKSYINNSDSTAAESVFQEKISKLPEKGMFGETINQDKFKTAFEAGIIIIDDWRSQGYELSAEEKIVLEENVNGVDLTVTGYIDCIATRTLPDGNIEVRILDWKTNSALPPDAFRAQQEFYSYLYYRKHNVLPYHSHWYMLKTNGKVEHHHDGKTIGKVERDLASFVEYIKTRGNNVGLYALGEYNHPFNNFFQACLDEETRRSVSVDVLTDLYRNKLYIKDLKDKRLIVGLDKIFSYAVEGCEFSDKFQEGNWDGKTHFFKAEPKGSVYSHSVPIGFYWMIQDFIEKFNERFQTNYKLTFTDKRNKEVQKVKYETCFKVPPFELRYYQNEAVQKVIEKKIGILALGTSAGKTAIIAEAIKQINKRSLVVVNRIELLEQTADNLSDFMGIKIGRMYEGTLDINNQVTVASIQTISSILDRGDASSKALITYLFNLNALFFDECQNVSDKGFYNKILKYLVNADYIIGLSGSAWRNYEPETLSMKALVGDIIYSKTTAELEAEGFICPTKCYFIRPPIKDMAEGKFGNYHDAYDYYVTRNVLRNTMVANIVNMYRDEKKILVLTKLISHGEIIQESIPDSFLVNSKTGTSERRTMFTDFKNLPGKVLIGSQQIFSTGIDIPDLDMIINVSASKSSIMAIQSIGRVKRKFPGKEFGYYIDFFDGDIEVFKQGSKKRLFLLEDHGNNTKIIYTLKDMVVE